MVRAPACKSKVDNSLASPRIRPIIKVYEETIKDSQYQAVEKNEGQIEGSRGQRKENSHTITRRTFTVKCPVFLVTKMEHS